MFKTWSGGPAMGPVASNQSPGVVNNGGAAGGWHPTVIYMIFLIVLEIFAVGVLSRVVLK